MHALRHSQRDLRARHARSGPTSRSTRRIRTVARQARAAWSVALEPQQQRVAAELEQAAAVLVGDQQNRLEAPADRVGDLLGALAALACEPLGQLREAGDVDEGGSALGGPAATVRILRQVLLKDPRHIQARSLYAGVGLRFRSTAVLRLYGRHRYLAVHRWGVVSGRARQQVTIADARDRDPAPLAVQRPARHFSAYRVGAAVGLEERGDRGVVRDFGQRIGQRGQQRQLYRRIGVRSARQPQATTDQEPAPRPQRSARDAGPKHHRRGAAGLQRRGRAGQDR